MTATITTVAWTHVGLVRDHNEDAIALPGAAIGGSPPAPLWTTTRIGGGGPSGGYVAAVIDGMGGHVGGGEASRIIAGRLSRVPDDVDLEAEIIGCNNDLYDEMDRRPELRAMGATVAAIQVRTGTVEVFNVGDARAYTHLDGFTTLLTFDDRAAQGSNVVTQSVGGTTQRTRLLVHRRLVPIDRSLRFLACSDGLSEYVAFSDIQDTLGGVEPMQVTDRLVNLALAAGAPDNVSVVIVDVNPHLDAGPSEARPS